MKHATIADPVDIYVGERVRFRRKMLRISQEKLANALGLTFQQIQKYERGSNRISASKLYKLAELLGVPINFFFNGYTSTLPKVTSLSDEEDMAYGIKNDGELLIEDDPLNKQETIEFIYHYYKLKEEDRQNIMQLVKSMASKK